jgi:hypothetical protein
LRTRENSPRYVVPGLFSRSASGTSSQWTRLPMQSTPNATTDTPELHAHPQRMGNATISPTTTNAEPAAHVLHAVGTLLTHCTDNAKSNHGTPSTNTMPLQARQSVVQCDGRTNRSHPTGKHQTALHGQENGLHAARHHQPKQPPCFCREARNGTNLHPTPNAITPKP